MKRVLFVILALVTLSALIVSCGGKVTTTPAATTTKPAATTSASVVPTATALVETTPAAADPNRVKNEFEVASRMSSFLYDIEAVQNYYDDGMTAVATFRPSATESASAFAPQNFQPVPLANIHGGNRVTTRGIAVTQKSKVPSEFLQPLPPSGAMPAPAGACPAAAKPQVTFKTAGGDAVTPDLIADKNLEAIPSELLTMAQDDPGSLFSLIEDMVPKNDQRLATASGWNTLLWSKLRAMQAPVESLMDYQLWNAENDVMTEIADMYYEKLVAQGVPQVVLDAYNASRDTNWYANSEPTPEDALDRMDIVAEMTGSITGTVYEQRDFTLEGASQTPIYGVQTGYGTVTWEHPAFGSMDFDVDINLDKFDDMGRAVGGTAVGLNSDTGYSIKFVYKPDGSKDGFVINDKGETVGYLTMTVDHEKFENYVDIKEGTTIKLPDVIPATTTVQ